MLHDGVMLILVLKIHVTGSSNKLSCDGSMTHFGSAVEGRLPTDGLEIHVTASFNQLLRDGSMLTLSPLPILLLKVNVTASCNKLCCDG